MSEQPKHLNEAMPIRKFTARWVVCGTLTLETAMHLGGEAEDRVDMPVLRDPKTGAPLLPGTTFAGALRNALADRIFGFEKAEDDSNKEAVSALFGDGRSTENGDQSPLVVFDALGNLPADGGVEIRDGVAIDPHWGVAEAGKKFDFEVLPAGTTFPVRVDLLVPGSGPEKEGEPDLLKHLAAALDAFSAGENGFGARRTRGLGRVSAKWTAKRFDLSGKEGWIAWAQSDHEMEASGDMADIRKALQAAAPVEIGEIAELGEDKRKRVVIDLNLSVAHDLLVRSPNAQASGPDVSHLRSGGVPVLPGTGLAGVMRSQATRIARLIRKDAGDADRWIDAVFGPRPKNAEEERNTPMRAARLRVGEAKIDGGKKKEQTRVAIDRFTGGAADTALFEEAPEVGGGSNLRLELRNPESGELGLVLLVLKDLLDGSLPVGGTSSVGRGVLTGTAKVAFWEGEGSPKTAQLAPGRPPGGGAAEKIDREIQAFHKLQTTPKSTEPSGAETGKGGA
jgi:CRISPR/Cas system CSM-associated protein Csm3 (group 7 of RAMP superfamily)